ncbi:unnamed protein product [Clavelina lepadiformis]|uniref:MyTH4 domain-containing protein n=1 Tax=Clavelina lepadiformis TaxID=159417 RepID=A0ABP0H601_CLALP
MSPVETNGVVNGHHTNGAPNSTLKVPNGQELPVNTEKTLSPVIEEIVCNHFAPGVKGHFEKRTNLPVLRSTNLSVFKRLKSNYKKESGSPDMQKVNGTADRARRYSFSGSVSNSSDMALVRSSWDLILSFMGDESEALEKGQGTRLFESTILERRKYFSTKKKLWRKQSSEISAGNKSPRKRPTSMYIESEPAENKDVLNNNGESVISGENLSKMTVLEKVQFLVNIGIESVHLRDEIYCQLVKQLTCNPSLRSNALGWILLALIMGCFSPSNKILDLISRFLDDQRTPYSSYCKGKLTRVLENGERKNAPCSLELQAAKSRQEIRLPVICMDHSVRTIWTDSSTTAEEMCRKLASKNRLGDSFGFSLYLALNNKLVTLGNGNFHILDAISQAEKFSKLNDVQEIWRIYYRREIFSISDATGIQDNQMRALLTYSQICGGVQSGEYQCLKAQDLALLMAHQYCVRNGLQKIDMKRVTAICDQNLPSRLCKDNNKKKWCQMVHSTLKALHAKYQPSEKIDTLDIMQQVIRYASKAFIDSFTKTFALSRFQRVDENLDGSSFTDVIMTLNHEKLVIRCNVAVSTREHEHDTKSPEPPLLELEVRNLKSVEWLDKRYLDRKL